ncbi:MAG: hypothetical protein ACK6DQ_12955 [Planctomycetota bacterium]
MFQSLRPLIFAASCCLAWMCSDLAIAQTTLAPNPTAKSALEPAGTLQADEVLRVGKGLEQQRRWQEAIQHYEKSLKSLPLNKQITERMQISRVHLDVTRRYADRSFIESVERSTPAQALEVYQEFVSKLETNYVYTVEN